MTEKLKEFSYDKWDFMLWERLSPRVIGQGHRTGWLPAIPKSGVQYLHRRFVEWMVVPCGDDFHRIGVSRKGRIALLDHPDRRRELAFAALGGDVPFCVKVMTMLAGGGYRGVGAADLPERVYEYFVECRRRHHDRRVTRWKKRRTVYG